MDNQNVVAPVEVEESFNLQDSLYSLTDSDLVDLPTGVSAEVREMTGNEQRNFMNRTKQMNGTAVQELLGACTVTFDGKPLPGDPVERTNFLLSMLSGDRATLVFHIRRHSLGSDFHFGAKCPNPECKKDNMWEVDLSIKEDFPLTPYKHGNQKIVEYESTARPGLKIQYSHLDGHAEMSIFRKRNALTSLSDLEQRIPKAWDGKTWVGIALNKVPDRLITELRQHIKANEGNIRTTVDLVCPNCDHEISFDLLQQPDFMTPSATS